MTTEQQSTLSGGVITPDMLQNLRQIREERLSTSKKSKGISLKPMTKQLLDDFQYELKKETGEHISHDRIVDYLLDYREQVKLLIIRDVTKENDKTT